MKSKNQIVAGIFAAAGMALLILDARTALSGAKEGVMLCLYTVIPSLFPFFVLSAMIGSCLTGRSIRFLRPVCKFCGIPEGSESLLLLGFVGGYPVGAQSIYEAYRGGQLHKTDAQRMLGFCNNGGPSFIFGMIAQLFHSPGVAWILWGIHIFSALITGWILPGRSSNKCVLNVSKTMTIPQALERSIKNIAAVCGWVVLFRVILAVLRRWLLYFLPASAQALIIGTLELTNGCAELFSIQSEWVRFLLCNLFLNFGGVCVAMQTLSACKDMGIGMYFPGKVLQSLIGIVISFFIQPILFPGENYRNISAAAILISCCVCIGYTFFIRRKKSAGNLAANVV